MLSLLTAVTVSCIGATGDNGPKPDKAYAVIVATNSAYQKNLKSLRYADDDGARFYELLSMATVRTELLSVLDSSTQKVFPSLASQTRAPRKDVLIDTLSSVFADIDRDVKSGHRTSFYFIYVGHGSVGEDGEGVMHLLDGRFSRSDLFQEVIAKSPATLNHVIIDACNAYLMIARRGGDDQGAVIDRAVDRFLEKENLEKYPNTGVIVSTSQAAEVHEWARFEAGIFSHEIRSAMAGAADVDHNGSVTYDEVRAFVSAANARVQDPKAKLDAFTAPPAIYLAAPLFGRQLAENAATLNVPAELAGRYFLEDSRGVRFADFNMSSDNPITLTLVPSSVYFLRDDTDQEIVIPLDTIKHADAALLKKRPMLASSRGSESITFQRDLFAVPFGRAYFEGFRASAPSTQSSVSLGLHRQKISSETGRPLTWSLGLSGLAVLGTGMGFGLSANSLATDYRNAVGTNLQVEEFRKMSVSRADTASLLYAIGGGLLLSSTASWLLTDY
jgi:hypothetical protein